MYVHDSASFIEVVVILPKDRPCGLFEAGVCRGECFRRGKLLLHDDLEISHVSLKVDELCILQVDVCIRVHRLEGATCRISLLSVVTVCCGRLIL